MTNNNMIIVPHPSYLPDLAPCDFALFPELKMKLKGRHFEIVSDIQRELQAVLDSIKENDFHGAFEMRKKRWDRCTRSHGDYFEGDGSQNFLFDLVRELSNTPCTVGTSYRFNLYIKVDQISWSSG
jgi:hypothetical protein